MTQPDIIDGDTAIQRVDPQQTALQHVNADNPIGSMLQALINRGGTAGDTAAAMEKLTDLYIKMEAEQARKDFAAAKCALQAELPRVIARRIIPNNDGGIRSTFAAYEDIANVVDPYLHKHGFSVSFTMRSESQEGKDRICAVCKLTHIGGHSETNEFAVRVSAPPKASEAQADGATRSYARRGALCDCLNVVIDRDDDARIEGAFISQAEATALRNRVIAAGSEIPTFLKIAGADSFEDIREGKLQVLRNILRLKEAAKRSSPAPSSSSAPPVPPKSDTTATQSPESAAQHEEPLAEQHIEGEPPEPKGIPAHGRTSPGWIDDLVLMHKPDGMSGRAAKAHFHSKHAPNSWEKLPHETQDSLYAWLVAGEIDWPASKLATV